MIRNELKYVEDLENFTVAFTKDGEKVEGIRLCRWIFDLLCEVLHLEDKPQN